MERRDLEEALKDNKLTFSKVKFTEISNIMKYVKAELMMDRTSLDYYYEIDVEDLLSSNMPKNDLSDLKNEGWSFSSDKKKIILYLN